MSVMTPVPAVAILTAMPTADSVEILTFPTSAMHQALYFGCNRFMHY